VAIAKDGEDTSDKDYSDTAWVATGTGHYDALAAAPIAYAQAQPIYLTDHKTNELDYETVYAMAKAGIKKVNIAGGTAAVTEKAEKLLEDFFEVKRFGGETATETSIKIAKYGINDCGMNANKMAVATGNTGKTWYDALAGAPLCGLNNSVMVLNRDKGDKTQFVGAFVAGKKSDIARGYIFGGTSAVSESVEALLEDAVA